MAPTALPGAATRRVDPDPEPTLDPAAAAAEKRLMEGDAVGALPTWFTTF
eukprot:CAMPEP_0175072610 /NCGR_PEP_ID=MMETSP0052_2-20121109/20017_1 /TAXON_ID=51329 ORGANISM="Polytomella parva, Strain SAG 63-3" /NCGR_SAMPLE_ID=MMETSP0052_2 /ASSEMBLY_ACC=CAM_ASM_000194 /LENGTH=49 /DNA_ID=CAMNT_0016340157 /DNA_START=1 /DNA_END=150 /DNA_ORIENTATION=+